jgi:hypothetical protein
MRRDTNHAPLNSHASLPSQPASPGRGPSGSRGAACAVLGCLGLLTLSGLSACKDHDNTALDTTGGRTSTAGRAGTSAGRGGLNGGGRGGVGSGGLSSGGRAGGGGAAGTGAGGIANIPDAGTDAGAPTRAEVAQAICQTQTQLTDCQPTSDCAAARLAELEGVTSTQTAECAALTDAFFSCMSQQPVSGWECVNDTPSLRAESCSAENQAFLDTFSRPECTPPAPDGDAG